MVSTVDTRAHPVLRDVACIRCHTEAIRVATITERVVYLRCDGCGDTFTMPERRGIWRHALPAPIPLKASLRRATDAEPQRNTPERR